jgi:hypothetical protein
MKNSAAKLTFHVYSGEILYHSKMRIVSHEKHPIFISPSYTVNTPTLINQLRKFKKRDFLKKSPQKRDFFTFAQLCFVNIQNI